MAVDCRNQDILTIEGLAEGEILTPVQQAFQDCGAIQCGFCTPGMVLSTTALLEASPHPSAQDIQKALEGLGFTGLELENRSRLFLHYEAAAPAMFARLSPQQDEELLLKRHRFLTTAHVD